MIRKRCRHRDQAYMMKHATRHICTHCGAWLSLGPSNDEPESVRVEIRAAEIAAILDTSNEDLVLLTSFAERRGLWLHAQWQRNGRHWGLQGGWTRGDYAGYLARQITRHDKEAT